MYAIVDIAGQQFKVEKDQKIFVHRLESEVGSQVDFDKVLLIDNDKSVTVGEPIINGAMVTVKILGHLKGDKVIVFKKKRRKGYKVKNGHRQYLTQVQVEEIIEKGAKPRVAEKSIKTVVKTKPADADQKMTETSTVDKKPSAVKDTKVKKSAMQAPVDEKVKAESKTKKQAEAKKTSKEATPKTSTLKKTKDKSVSPKVKKAGSESKADTGAKVKTAAKPSAVKKENKSAAVKKSGTSAGKNKK